MNVATFERAQVAAYAYRVGRRTGSLDCMKAICYVFQNRLRRGWGDGTWLDLIESASAVEGNIMPIDGEPLDVQDRLLQMMIRDIDDIYLGSSSDDTKQVIQDALYFQFIDLPASDWFVENIIRMPNDHPRIAQVGPIAFFR